MFNQIRRLWKDDGRNDKDFSPQEIKLKEALRHLQQAAAGLSKASEVLIDVINTRGGN